MYKKILVPLDGSELAECALPHVINLVQDGSVGEVTVLNVYKVDLSPVGAKGYAQGINVNQIKKSMFTASANYLAMWNPGSVPRESRLKRFHSRAQGLL